MEHPSRDEGFVLASSLKEPATTLRTVESLPLARNPEKIFRTDLSPL
jgi:hypothetical protein